MKFSVLMSLYEKENPLYLDECLNSLWDQTVRADEVVIVYDGKVKQTLDDVVSKYKNKLNIKIIQLKNNMGLGLALREGLKFCSNDYVARMDTDDICLKNRFEEQVKFLEENPNVILLGSSVLEFNDKGVREKLLPLDYYSIREYSKKKNPFNHMTVFFKKNCILDIGSYQHHLYMEDYNLWLRLLAKEGEVRNLKEPLVKVRVGNGMLSKRRGIKYINSEIQLLILKKKLKIDKSMSLYNVFFIRVISRFIPEFFLDLLYRYDRKRTTSKINKRVNQMK